ncbi:MAG TPA: hypothetical protein VIQ31_19280 [Phormidium sp.]
MRFSLLNLFLEQYEAEQLSNPSSSFFLPPTIVSTRRNDLDMYMDFFSLFVAPVVGKKRFENLCWRQKLSDFVSISDEALALIIFENNYDRWIAMGKKKDWTNCTIRPKFTTGGNASQTPKLAKGSNVGKKKCKGKNKDVVVENSNDDGARNSTCAKYQGWSVEGIKKYNVYFDEIKEERRSALGVEFEEAFLNYCIEQNDNSRKKPRLESMTFEACRHELWDIGSQQVTNDDSGNVESVSGSNNCSSNNTGSSSCSNQDNAGASADTKVVGV